MNALAAALVKAQKDMPKVEPDGRANYGSYVTLDHLIAKTRPVLNKNGLAITQFPATSDLGAPVLRTVLIHESGEQLSADTPLFLQKQDMQAFGAAITYARRYGWASVLGIAEQEDDDGAAASRPADTVSAPAPSAGATKPAVDPPAAVGTGSAGAAGAQASAAPADTTTFTTPAGREATKAQKKILTDLFTSLGGAGTITEDQFVKAARGQGATGDGFGECIESLSMMGATDLIARLRNLEKNSAKAA